MAVKGYTPDGMSISPEIVDRAEGSVTRIMIRDKDGNILYGYRLNSNETRDEAVEKWKNGTYNFHLPPKK